MSSVDTESYGPLQFDFWNTAIIAPDGARSNFQLISFAQFGGKVDLEIQAWIKKTGTTSQTAEINVSWGSPIQNVNIASITATTGEWDIRRKITLDANALGGVKVALTQGSQFNTYSVIRYRVVRYVPGSSY